MNGMMEEWKDGKLGNSTIRRFDNWKNGKMEEWNETYQACKTCEVLKDTYP